MLYSFIVCLAYAALAFAIPTWQSMPQWTSAIGTLVPGASSIQAIPIDEDDQNKSKWRKPTYLMLRKDKSSLHGPRGKLSAKISLSYVFVDLKLFF
jgi:hypothetical protein